MIAEGTYRYLTVETDAGIATVTLTRAEKRNALSLEVMRELIGTFAAIGADRQPGGVQRGREGRGEGRVVRHAKPRPAQAGQPVRCARRARGPVVRHA